MDKMLGVLEEKMVPLATKLEKNRYLTAIKEGFFGVMSLLIIGSFFLLFSSLPINGYAEFMASIFGDNWSSFFLVPYDATMNIMTIYVLIGMARSLANHYKIDEMAAMTSTVVSFIILTPMITAGEGAAGIPVANLGPAGFFVGMITVILAVEVLRFVYSKNWTIKLPDSVPENVSRSFSALIPALFVILLFNVVRLLFGLTRFETMQNFIYHYLQVPLTGLGATLGSAIFQQLAQQLLWSLGINGSSIVGSIMNPINLALTMENAAAFAAGNPLPNIINAQFYGSFVIIGGTGGTLGLAIYLLFFAKSKQYKAMGRLVIAPGIFNINEPVVYGIPIVLNPIMIIPFILAPIILVVTTYTVMSLGLVPYTNGANLPWSTPAIISGFLLCGWRGAVYQLFEILLSMLIYMPFIRSLDKMAFEKEHGGNPIEVA